METKIHFSSASGNWSTPQDFFDKLNEEFHFTLDPCADDLNHKCEKYYTEQQNGLNQDWSGESVFCNPPYGRDVPKWVPHEACEATGFAKFWNTIINFFRRLFGKPEICVCGKEI